MSELHRRLQKIESKVGQGALEDARALVNFYQEYSLLGPDEDIEKLVAEYARDGVNLASVIDSFAGTSLGPPALRKGRGTILKIE